MRNAFTGQVESQPSANRRGRGASHNRGGGPGGGGGGGGGGNNRVPKRGLYGGKAGEALTNQDPTRFFTDIVNSMIGQSSGTPYDAWARQTLVGDLYGEYGAANAANQRLSARDWLRRTYGAGPEGKKGRTLGGGALAVDTPEMQSRYASHTANADPMAWTIAQGQARGDLAVNGNQQASDYYQQVYAPELQRRFEAARISDPKLNYDDFFNAVDPNEWRRAYANRAPSQRQPSSQPVGGRWSYWA